MHVIFRESHGLEDGAAPTDLGQSPADLVVLSLSDSDLGAFAAGWHRGGGPQGRMPTLRLANIAALAHPLSVDTYVEQTLSGARGILIRLIGGVPYWPYGLQQIEALAREKGIALAVLPGDGRPDPRLDAISTVPASTLRRVAALCDTGGAVAAQAALAQLALAAGLYAGPVSGAKALPEVGGWTPEEGVTCPAVAAFAGPGNLVRLDGKGAAARMGEVGAAAGNSDVGAAAPWPGDAVPPPARLSARMKMPVGAEAEAPLALVVFYRSYLVAADTGPVAALIAALRARGFRALGLFVPSLKAPGARGWLARQVAGLGPAAIVNATAFSGRGGDGEVSPLDRAGVPVFQVALATSTREAWAGAARGLSPADLVMHVVLSLETLARVTDNPNVRLPAVAT